MNTQCIQKTMVTIAQSILTALYEGMVRLGCGLGGLSYED